MLSYGDNLKSVRTKLGITAMDFATFCGVQYRTYLSYERGERSIPWDIVAQIVNEYKLNSNFLLTGEGPMFLPQKSAKQQKYEQAFKERKTFGKRLNYYQAEENLMDDEIAKIIDSSERRVEKLGLDKEEPTLAELKALKKHSGIPIDLWVDGELTDDSNTVTQMLSPEEQKMLEFLKKAKENKLI